MRKPTLDQIKHIKDKISKGLLEEALRDFKGRKWKKKSLTLLQRLKDLDNRNHKGVIASEAYYIERNRIADAAILLLEEYKNQTKDGVPEELLDEIREGLRESYRKRISNKLAERFPINLQIKYSTEGNKHRTDLLNKTEEGKTIRRKNIQEELISIFDRHNGRLLIIGEPGLR